MTPDPYGGSASTRTPATWKRYNYSLGDPANMHDPDGLAVQCATGVQSVENGDTTVQDFGCIATSEPTFDMGNVDVQIVAGPLRNAPGWFPSTPGQVQAAVKNTSSKLAAAEQAALDALKNPNCAALFNVGNGLYDPIHCFLRL